MPSIITASTASNTALNLSADTSGVLEIRTGSSPTMAMTIDTSQNVGIGTSSPATRLNVFSSTTNTARIRVTGTGSTNGNFRGYEFGSSGGFSGGIFQDEGTSALSFWSTSGGESMRIDSSGNVGIGTTSPSSQNLAANQLVIGNNSTNVGLTVAAGTSSQASLFFSKGTGSGAQQAAGYVFYQNANDFMAFGTSNTERMRILSTGNILSLAGGSTTATGTGIAFPATVNGSPNANTLDDYEEGTFTPSFLNVTATYVAPTAGLYVKIGKQVFVSLVVTTSALTRNANAFEIGGLPFAIAAVNEAFSPPSLFPESGMNPAGGAGNMYGLFVSNSTFARMYTIASGTGDNYITMTYNDLVTGGNRIRISGCYLVD